MPDDDGISRRKFLGAAAAAATAGCIGEDDTSQSTDEPNTPNSTPTGTSSNDSNENSTDSEKDNSSTTDNPQDDELEDNESQVEIELQNYLNSEYGMWGELDPDQVNLPNSAKSQNDIPWNGLDPDTQYTSQQLAQLIGDDIYADINGALANDDPGADILAHFFGVSETKQKDSNEPYRELEALATYEDLNGDNKSWTTVELRAFEEGAVEEFLSKYVEGGLIDYSNDLEEELLESAES
jgi:hypothetical protein